MALTWGTHADRVEFGPGWLTLEECNMTDWNKDEDWDAIVLGQTKHASHHVGIDRYGSWFCRECSKDRMYLIPDQEVKRMLLAYRPSPAQVQP